MGPHGVSITVISGQENGGEVVVAASVFLKMDYLSITPVSRSSKVREEFLLSLDVFSYREFAGHSSPHDKWFTEKIVEPSESLANLNLFWLALDEQGYAIAEKVISENGFLPDKTIYHSVRKLNLIAETVAPYPQQNTSSAFWQEIQRDLYRVAWEHRRVKSERGRRKLFDEHLPMSSTEKEYYSWYKSLYDSLLPWKETIYNMQSDGS